MRGIMQRSGYWIAAGRGAVAAVAMLAGIAGLTLDTGAGNLLEFAGGALVGTVLALACALAARLLLRLVRATPDGPLALIAGALAALATLRAVEPAPLLRTLAWPPGWEWPFARPDAMALVPLAVLVLAAAGLAGLAALLAGGGWAALAPRRRGWLAGGTGLLAAAGAWVVLSLAAAGHDPYPLAFRTLAVAGGDRPVMPGDPAAPGPFAVEHLTYGAGDNPRRPEFGAGRGLESRTVDATALLPEWRGVKRAMREAYWGFGLDAAPLNGRVWEPRGAGPFPLVLIVHGNHDMEEYSDPGYAYLGELLASRGYLAVSIDENVVNGTWSGDFRGREMPLRAWLILQHLALWRDWNDTPGHRYGGRVDMDRIALAGHSRGGEAIAIAAAFNGLPAYPDDATVSFDFGFRIRALISIAQIDQRYHRELHLQNVDFLALHGSYDGDVYSYHGLRQMNRIGLDAAPYRFKAGIYIHGANHGQFNTVWGRQDASPPDAWRLNLAPLIPGEDQRRVASVYISAFLDASLRDERRYLPLFRDPRAGSAWLPDLVYVNQFQDSSFRPVATFEEDLDVTTATLPGARLGASGFSLWREQELRHRDDRRQGTSALVLGWAGDAEPEYTIELPADFGADPAERLTFAVSGSTERPVRGAGDDDDEEVEDPQAPDFVIELEDAAGRRASVRGRDCAALAPPLRVQQLKNAAATKDEYKADWEPVLQNLEVPLAAYAREGIDLDTLRFLRLRFDREAPGVVIVDDIGLRRDVGVPTGSTP